MPRITMHRIEEGIRMSSGILGADVNSRKKGRARRCRAPTFADELWQDATGGRSKPRPHKEKNAGWKSALPCAPQLICVYDQRYLEPHLGKLKRTPTKAKPPARCRRYQM